MQYFETRPSPDLAPFVEYMWELHGGGNTFSQPIFPDGRIEIVVHLGDRPVMSDASAPQPDVMVAGQMTSALRLGPVSRLHAVGIRFTPAGACAWLSAPAHELTDRVLGLDDVGRDLTARIRDTVHLGATSLGGIARIENILRATIRTRPPVSRCVDHAVQLTLRRSGRVTVDALARACDISARQLERQYLDVVGLRPKAFARTRRFQRALRELQRGVPAAVAHVAFIQDRVPPAAAD
jgi:AraC-like DNA-binding protein